jgi:8-oxo-dGTP diphosphatase
MTTATAPKNAPALSRKGAELKSGIYEHYKKLRYKVLGVALHSETLEECVVYQALYGEMRIWVRPLEMFMESVILDNGESVPRFTSACDLVKHEDAS